jgi:PTH1 family peptidyl-tRNA hydrolase
MKLFGRTASKRILIVGLGNPGPKYRNTRHNIGFMVLDELAAQTGVDFSREKFQGLFAEAREPEARILLLKPMTFMNRSGISVAQAMRNQVDSLADLLVVVDDADLPLGRLRLRKKGSAGGHNGLRSIIEQAGGSEFPRLRIGIGKNESAEDLRDHVLGTFAPDEAQAVRESVERAAEAALTFARSGVDEAMNRFNSSG